VSEDFDFARNAEKAVTKLNGKINRQIEWLEMSFGTNQGTSKPGNS
jgi:hypothetical protein